MIMLFLLLIIALLVNIAMLLGSINKVLERFWPQ